MVFITIITLLIILKIYFMSEVLDEIKQDLIESKETVAKISADVDVLHAKIDALSDNPDAEAIAEIKALSTSLKESLVVVDEKTEDAPVVEQPAE
jgi:cell division protein FtsB